ncbi:MAG: phosphohydrolase [Acidovorax sp.]|nr:phosphohydrolase [Acidovorax sp.]
MNLVAINFESVPLGEPLPFALRAASGALLAQKGFVVRNASELSEITGRGIQLCVDVDESGESYRAYVGRLQQMLMSETSLGELAAVKMSGPAAAPPPARNREERGPLDWSELQLRTTQVLRAPKAFDFRERFLQLHEDLARRCEQAPDATLLALVFLSAQETRMYSGTHAMLVSCICMVVGREMLRWPPAKVRQLGAAGLSMNIAMTELQDQLAQQTQPLTARQIAAVEDHANRSAALLAELGITDNVWLEAVRHHHHRKPGPFNEKTEGQQMARLIQRADVFGARIAPRAARSPMPVTAAMQASYYDEENKVDEAGAALVKGLGVYPPGAFVRLASQEVGVVLRRGVSATTPRVAVVTNRLGMPTGELIPRDTSQAQWKITGAVAHKDVRVKISLERLLPLV